MKNIFFSYCWADEQKALPFVENLIKKINYDINDYYLDRKINKVGDQYWKNINNALATCQLFIFFNSNNYYNSSACCKEYVWALQRQKEENIKIIEIKLEDTDLYRPYKDQLYVKFEDDQILDKLYDAIYNNDFSGFEKKSILSIQSINTENNLVRVRCLVNYQIQKLIVGIVLKDYEYIENEECKNDLAKKLDFQIEDNILKRKVITYFIGPRNNNIKNVCILEESNKVYLAGTQVTFCYNFIENLNIELIASENREHAEIININE